MARRLYDLTIVEAVGTIHRQREGTTLRQSVDLIRLRPEKSFGRFPSVGSLYERPRPLAINNLNCSNPWLLSPAIVHKECLCCVAPGKPEICIPKLGQLREFPCE